MKNQFINIWMGCIISAILFGSVLHAKEYRVSSPNDQLEIQIDVDSTITFSVHYQKNEIIAPSPISLTLENGKCLGKYPAE